MDENYYNIRGLVSLSSMKPRGGGLEDFRQWRPDMDGEGRLVKVVGLFEDSLFREVFSTQPPLDGEETISFNPVLVYGDGEGNTERVDCKIPAKKVHCPFPKEVCSKFLFDPGNISGNQIVVAYYGSFEADEDFNGESVQRWLDLVCSLYECNFAEIVIEDPEAKTKPDLIIGKKK